VIQYLFTGRYLLHPILTLSNLRIEFQDQHLLETLEIANKYGFRKLLVELEDYMARKWEFLNFESFTIPEMENVHQLLRKKNLDINF
jgi:hypothetical protein